MIELTEQQQREIEQESWPACAVNPSTQEKFVLLPAQMWERLRSLLEEQDEIAAVEETYPLVSEVLDADESSSRESA